MVYTGLCVCSLKKSIKNVELSNVFTLVCLLGTVFSYSLSSVFMHTVHGFVQTELHALVAGHLNHFFTALKSEI